jgi:hypothetical protein
MSDLVVHRRLDIVFTPCVPEQLTEANWHLQDKKCLADYNNKTDLERKKRESIEYLNEPNFVVMTNKESIDTQNFGNRSFIYESHIQS